MLAFVWHFRFLDPKELRNPGMAFRPGRRPSQRMRWSWWSSGYAGPDGAGLRAVETRLEALLQRAIAQGAPTRRVRITPEFVTERLGARSEVRVRRSAGFRAEPTAPEPDAASAWAVSSARVEEAPWPARQMMPVAEL